ncbi:hypothetical protein AB0L71_28350 [Streptomyces sp. NPDC052052]|uniref:hypothetical protein n=1 Tax=Streptomyces sp. NPDC052052 TaxID=3154756 RepID=UPI0034214536
MTARDDLYNYADDAHLGGEHLDRVEMATPTFFKPGHLYAARVGRPEGRERSRFLCESVTTDEVTGEPVAHGQHGRLRTADQQWIWTPNPRTFDDWRGGSWTDITDETS